MSDRTLAALTAAGVLAYLWVCGVIDILTAIPN